jgi:hypothetical protein
MTAAHPLGDHDGKILEFLRSCYAVDKYRSEGGVLVPRRWVYFWADPLAPVSPRHSFGSSNYEAKGLVPRHGADVTGRRRWWVCGSHLCARRECIGVVFGGASSGIRHTPCNSDLPWYASSNADCDGPGLTVSPSQDQFSLMVGRWFNETGSLGFSNYIERNGQTIGEMRCWAYPPDGALNCSWRFRIRADWYNPNDRPFLMDVTVNQPYYTTPPSPWLIPWEHTDQNGVTASGEVTLTRRT